ncbi:hypothetical protein HPB52_014853 [Rhipicephalus sanguineus]|uniref:Uncharacterized protein n=1 Tax=Rhipicephalus sanguineus TaxID=34632 RepID=A0A9D4PMB4_RHISA|nr:hypothetical protein HPB52_014853 [Rhipicephalus sanguineus]
MHVTRKLAKWKELYRAMHEEGMVPYGLAETHMRDLVEPRANSEWSWAKESESRKGGGVGVL